MKGNSPMPYYICAWDGGAGDRILGNRGGQAIIRHRRPERSRNWLNLGIDLYYPRVHHWTLEREDGTVLFTKLNPHYSSNK